MVSRQQCGLAFGYFREMSFENFGNTSVECASRLAQQGTIGRVLHQRMLEQIGRVRRYAFAKQQIGPDETASDEPSSATGLRATATNSP